MRIYNLEKIYGQEPQGSRTGNPTRKYQNLQPDKETQPRTPEREFKTQDKICNMSLKLYYKIE